MISIFVGMAAAIPGCWLICYLYRAPMFATCLILIIFSVEALIASSDSLVVAGTNIFPPDLVFVPIALVAILRIFNKGSFKPLMLGWIFFGGVLFVNFILGSFLYGKAAGVEFRGYFYFWSGCLYFMSFKISEIPVILIGRYWIKVAILISSVVIIRWATDAAGLTDWTVVGAGVPLRVITAGQAFFLACGLIILIGININRMGLKPSRLLIWLLFIVILLLQHRSVWLAAVIGSGTLYFFMEGKITNKIGPVVGILSILVVVGAFMSTTDFGKKAIASIEDSGVEAVRGEGTVSARTYSWIQLLNQWQQAGLKTQLIGFPFGTTHSRFESDLSTEAVEYAPHNFYLETLLRSGLIGLSTFLFIIVKAIYGLWKIERYRVPVSGYAGVFLALIVGEVVYFIPYGAGYEQTIIFGLALNLASSVSSQKLQMISQVIAQQVLIPCERIVSDVH